MDYTYLILFCLYTAPLINTLLFVLFAAHISSSMDNYLQYSVYLLEALLSLFLMYRFNFWHIQGKCNDLDRQVAFACGFYLFIISLTNIGIQYNFQTYVLQNIRNKFS